MSSSEVSVLPTLAVKHVFDDIWSVANFLLNCIFERGKKKFNLQLFLSTVAHFILLNSNWTAFEVIKSNINGCHMCLYGKHDCDA